MAGITVADIISSLETNNMTLETSKEVASNALDKTKSIYETIATDNIQDAADRYTVTATQQAGVLRKQSQDSAATAAFGTDLSKTSNIVSELAPQLLANKKKLDELDKVIAAKKSVTFLDNPLEFILNQVTLTSDVEQFNGIARQYNRDSDFIANMQNLTQEAVQTNLATLQTTSETSAAAASRSAALVATTAANKALIEAQSVDVDKVRIFAELDGRQLENKVRAYSIVASEEERAIRRQERAEAAEERRMRFEIYRKEKEEKGQIDKAETQMLEIVNAGRVALNERPFTSKYDLAQYKNTTEGKEHYNMLFDTGYQVMEAASRGGGSVNISSSPAETAKFLVETRGQLNPAATKTQALITETFNDVITGKIPIDPKIDKKNKKEMEGVTDLVIESRVREMASDVTKNKSSNIYSPPPISAIAGNKAVKNSPFFQKILKPELEASPEREFDPQYILNRARDAIINGELNYNAVIDGVVLTANAAIENNNALRSYERVGLPPQSSLVSPIKTDPNAIYLTGDRNVDLANRVSVSNAINKMLSYKITAGRYIDELDKAGVNNADIVKQTNPAGIF